MFLKQILSFLLFFIFQGPLSCCEVTISACGQGNAVRATYRDQCIIVDAGSKAYAAFAQQQEDADDETELNKQYRVTIHTDNQPPVFFHQTGLPEHIATLSDRMINTLKAEFLERFYDFLNGKDLRGVFISHPDGDHLNMLDSRIGKAPVLFGGKFNHPNYNEIKKFVQENRILKPEAFANISFKGRTAPRLSLLAYNQGNNPNDNSLVIQIKDSHSILLPGDATQKTWDAITDSDLPSDILLVSHHGAHRHGCTTAEILDKIKPKLCLISAGLRYNHPKLETITILQNYFNGTKYRVEGHLVTCFREKKLCCYFTNAPIFTTVDNGDLTVNLSSPLTLNCQRDFFYTPSIFFDYQRFTLFFKIANNRVFKIYNSKYFMPMFDDDIYEMRDGTLWLKRKGICFQLTEETVNE